MRQPRLIFIGDDFTGSTDALEVLASAGLRARLIMQLPQETDPIDWDSIDVLGIACTSRSMQPDEMKETLQPVFEWVHKQSPRFIHYKICSTFDSSATHGNLVTVMELAKAVFGIRSVPILAAAPSLGRFTAFGHHFAAWGTGKDTEVYALDVHPSMGKHPVTPALDSDLRLHLRRQGAVNPGLVDLRFITGDAKTLVNKFTSEYKSHDALILDATEPAHIQRIGKLLDEETPAPCFIIGSSGVEQALYSSRANGKLWPETTMDGPLLVLSGSCSPVTGNQIEYALQHGFAELVLQNDMSAGIQEAIQQLASGRSLIIHSNGTRGKTATGMDPAVLGVSLASAALRIVQDVLIHRIVIAGGDTSGHVATGLGIQSLEVFHPFIKGAPICTAHTAYLSMRGKQFILKGGQVGDETFFLLAAGQETTKTN